MKLELTIIGDKQKRKEDIHSQTWRPKADVSKCCRRTPAVKLKENMFKDD